MSHKSAGSTHLSEVEFNEGLKLVKSFLVENNEIRNRQLFEITEFTYDQAIKFFNKAIARGYLERRGKTSSTHYVLVDKTEIM